MTILKVIPYPNHSGLEATWLEQIKAPDTEIPEVPATFDGEGNELTPFSPASVQEGAITETQIWCQSYHPTQMQLFRDKAAEYGTLLDDYADLISAIESAYVPPDPEPVQVPQVITIRQAKLALLSAGLLDDVDAAIAQADRATQIEWEYATEVHRNWLTLRSVQGAGGLTDEQVDELFIRAASL